MRLVSTKENAANTAERWKRNYFKNSEWRYGEDKQVIYQNLQALGSNPSPDCVDSVIGNSSWTRITCDECGSSVEEAVMVGEEPDYESATATICKNCLTKALKEFK